jgi:formamidopyrimidine-DNA glycosylase
MITILAILITWYLTKVYYTKTPFIHMPELDQHGLMTAKCARCSQYLVISQEDMRNPYYCLNCKVLR